MPITKIKTCEDYGCHDCGDTVLIELLPTSAALASSSSGKILATVIDFEQKVTGQVKVQKTAYDASTCKAVTIWVYEDQYQYVYTLSYADDQTTPAGEQITCDQIDKLCCVCGMDYLLDYILQLIPPIE